MYLVGLYASGDLDIPVGSGGRTTSEAGVSAKWLSFYGAIFLVTIPAIAVACVASQATIEMFIRIDDVPLKRLVSLKSKITVVFAMVGLFIAFIIIGLK